MLFEQELLLSVPFHKLMLESYLISSTPSLMVVGLVWCTGLPLHLQYFVIVKHLYLLLFPEFPCILMCPLFPFVFWGYKLGEIKASTTL